MLPNCSKAQWIRGSLYSTDCPALIAYSSGNAWFHPGIRSTAFWCEGARLSILADPAMSATFAPFSSLKNRRTIEVTGVPLMAVRSWGSRIPTDAQKCILRQDSEQSVSCGELTMRSQGEVYLRYAMSVSWYRLILPFKTTESSGVLRRCLFTG